MSDQAAPSGIRQSIVFQAVLLGGFAMAAAAMLAGGDIGTREAIEARRAEDLKASLTQVIPEEIHDNDLLAGPLSVTGPAGAPLTVYRAMRGGAVTGVAFQTHGFGYAGEIVLIMGIERDGRLLGVRVLSHAETPGLGDKIEAAKSDWIDRFTGLSLAEPTPDKWKVKKDGGRFDQFSGATITPRAVVKAVKEGLDFFAANQGALLAVEPSKEATR